jgi:hypothetical protein
LVARYTNTDKLHEHIYAPYGIETAQVGVFLATRARLGMR